VSPNRVESIILLLDEWFTLRLQGASAEDRTREIESDVAHILEPLRIIDQMHRVKQSFELYRSRRQSRGEPVPPGLPDWRLFMGEIIARRLERSLVPTEGMMLQITTVASDLFSENHEASWVGLYLERLSRVSNRHRVFLIEYASERNNADPELIASMLNVAGVAMMSGSDMSVIKSAIALLRRRYPKLPEGRIRRR
jgi:hypothetical protein